MNKKIEQVYEELAHGLGFHFDRQGTALYGKRGNYDLMVYPQNTNYPYMFSVVASVAGKRDALTKEACKQFKNDNKPVSALSQSGNIVTMTLKNNPKKMELQEDLRSSMDALVALCAHRGSAKCMPDLPEPKSVSLLCFRRIHASVFRLFFQTAA